MPRVTALAELARINGFRAAAVRRKSPHPPARSISMAQTKRGTVYKIDLYTSFGHGDGDDHRQRLGIDTKGPDAPNHRSGELEA